MSGGTGGTGRPAGSRRAAAKPSKQALNLLIAEARDGIVVVDHHGTVLMANPAAERMLRPPGEALIGSEFGFPLASADRTEIDLPGIGIGIGTGVAAAVAAAEMRVSAIDWDGTPAWVVMLRELPRPRRDEAAEGAERAGRRDQADVQRLGMLAETERLAGLGSWEVDVRTGEISRSPGWMYLLGRSAEELAAHPHMLYEVVHPDDQEQWRRTMEEAQFQGRRFDTEFRLLRKDGEIRVMRTVGEPVVGPDGRPVKVIGFARDITEERRAERAARETSRLLQAIADNAMAAICVKDRAGRFLFSNIAHSAVTGRRREDLLGRTDHDVLPAALADELRAHDLEVINSGSAVTREHTVELPTGEPMTWLSAKFPIPDDEGHPYAVGVVSLDVSELKRADEALKVSGERFRLLAENSQDIIFLAKLVPRPIIEYVSPAIMRVAGRTAEEMLGDMDKSLALVHPDDRARLLAHFERQEPGPVLVRYLRADGTWVWIEEHITSIPDADGRIVAIEGNLRDVNDRILAEEEKERLTRQLERAERLESLGRLAGGIAHDFNNLLAVILGTIEFLGEDLEPGDPRQADVRRIAHAAQRGAALVRQLLIFSRREPSRPEVLDLNDVINKIEDMLQRTIGEDVEFAVRLSRHLPAVRIDRAKMEQVVLNLVVNARTAMPEGGRLTLATDGVTIPDPNAPPPPLEWTGEAQPQPVPAGDYVRLSVADTGHGMTPEVARRAFEPFFTTRERGKGTGLGLATVHGVVSEAGGHITLETRPGVGTTIQIFLPAVGGPSGETAGAAEEAPHGRGETILLVEDEEPVREVVTRLLDRSGYRLLSAHDADQAVEICAEPGTTVDLLLTDLIMPGMSGLQLAERLRATTRPDLPVLFMSGYAAEQEDTAHRPVVDPETILGKPFDTATALRRIRSALDTPSPGAPPPSP